MSAYRGKAELTPTTPAPIAAAAMVREAFSALASAVRKARRSLAGDPDLAAADVHRLRCAARRALAALDIADAVGPGIPADRLRRRVRRLRRAGGRVRDGDIHAGLLAQLLDAAGEDQAATIRTLAGELEARRASAAARLLDRLDKVRGRRVRSASAKLAHRLASTADGSRTFADAAGRILTTERDLVRTAAAAGLALPDNLHALRIRVKHARDVLDLLRPAVDGGAADDLLARLKVVQDRLGGVQDAAFLAERLAASGELGERARTIHGKRLGDLLDWWAGIDLGALLDEYAALARSAAPEPTASAVPLSSELQGRAPRTAAPGPAGPTDAPLDPSRPLRLAAIDVGSNSVRLVIAETRGRGRYRVLDDEREVARLASGLTSTQRLSEPSMERAIGAVTRMRAIADGYGVAALRAIATSAVREAENRDEFVERLRTRSGVDLEVIDRHEEGRLAFVSASHAFDLTDLAAAVADIGGGSAQLILSQRGVVDSVASAPLGAVRLTDMFGGPEACAGPRFKDMRRHIRDTLRADFAVLPFVPQVLIATGGTFTTLGAMVLAREHPGDSPVPVQGTEIDRAQVSHLLDLLRGLSTRARARIPGLPPERADIIVAGLAVVERLLDHLGVNRILAHDRGIRDGLLIRMIDEQFPQADATDRMVGVRAFARACRYEERHAEHVTRLALSLHDQLAASGVAPGGWSTPAARSLLEAASVLHDVGYLINYDKHHKHGYHLIINSDLHGYTSRELEVIANIARYHRRKPPAGAHPNFARLAPADRELVRRLAGILRIADGLDRTHTERVSAVELAIGGGRALLRLHADRESETDAWGAAQKSDLFRDAFRLEPVFEFAPAPSESLGEQSPTS